MFNHKNNSTHLIKCSLIRETDMVRNLVIESIESIGEIVAVAIAIALMINLSRG
jgi:hypothetical protein